MTGPGLALILIPITATAGLMTWLIMVFAADRRPRQADRNPAGTHAPTPARLQNAGQRRRRPRTRPIDAAVSDPSADGSALEPRSPGPRPGRRSTFG
jgi:hypothetical protein